MSTMTFDPAALDARPQPGPRIAPPLPTSSAPWASSLDYSITEGPCTWVLLDGVLLPVPNSDAATQSRRGLFRRGRLG